MEWIQKTEFFLWIAKYFIWNENWMNRSDVDGWRIRILLSSINIFIHKFKYILNYFYHAKPTHTSWSGGIKVRLMPFSQLCRYDDTAMEWKRFREVRRRWRKRSKVAEGEGWTKRNARHQIYGNNKTNTTKVRPRQKLCWMQKKKNIKKKENINADIK